MATWNRLVSGSTAGNVSLDVDYAVTSVTRTSNTNVRVTYGIRFSMSTSTYTYNSIAAFCPAGGTRYYAFNHSSGHTNKGTYYYANTTGSTTTSETCPFTQDITVGITQTSASFEVGYGWDAYQPSQKGKSTITVTFPTGATAPTGCWCSVNSYTETSVSLSGGYSSDGNATITASGYQYHSEGYGWSAYNGETLVPGIKYWFRYYASNSQGTTYSGETSITTHYYPHITSAPNFTIGNVLAIKFHNPLGRSCSVFVINPLGQEIGGDTTTGDTISGYTNQTFLNFWYAGIPNSQSGKYRVRLVVNDLGRDTTVDGGTYYIKGTETPTFEASNIINVIDTLHANDITGNNTKIIKGHNKITGSITKMTGNYSASGKKYVINASATPNSITLNYDNGATKNFSFDNLTTNSFSVIAYDTRDLNVTRTKNVDLIDYSEPRVANFTITRIDGLGEYAILNADGTFTHWSGWSEIKKYNSIQKAYIRYKKSTDGSYGSWIDVTSMLSTNSNGNWTLTGTLDDVFTNTFKYDFQMYVTDLLESSSTSYNTLSTANGFLWRDLANKRLGINKKPTCALDVNGDVNVDGVITSRNKVEVDNEVVAKKVVASEIIKEEYPVVDTSYFNKHRLGDNDINIMLNRREGGRLTNVDLNTFVEPGVYGLYGSQINAPKYDPYYMTNGYQTLTVEAYSGSHMFQTFKVSTWSGELHAIYVRASKDDGSNGVAWAGWRKIELTNTNQLAGFYRARDVYGNIFQDDVSGKNYLLIRTPINCNGATMNRVKIEGYLYRNQSPLHLEVCWYNYWNGSAWQIINHGWWGIGPDQVRIAQHSDASGSFNWLEIHFPYDNYFTRFVVTEVCTTSEGNMNSNLWHSIANADPGSYTGSVVTVPRKT